MIKGIIFFFLIFISNLAFTQQKSLLYRYEISKADETLYGYKDKTGKIIFPAKYGGLGLDSTFNHIVAVMEKTKKGFDTYYLLSNGKKVLKDSVYIDGDYNFDSEQEGMIRFQTKKPYTIGFLNEEGKIVIPNMYNYATAFTNGFAVALQGATKINGEHWFWKGGTRNVITKKNKIIIKNFTYNENLIDWYSLKINEKVDTNYYVSFKTVKGDSYSFINIEKQFAFWFNNSFKKEYESILSNNFFSIIEVEKQINDTMTRDFVSPEKFKEKYSNVWQQKIKTALENSDSTIQIEFTTQDYLPGFGDYSNYNVALDNNGRFLKNKFPMFTILVNYYKSRQQPLTQSENLSISTFNRNYENDQQEAITFMRINNQYKLVEVVQRK
jgi:hypothetical protein